MAAVTGCRLSRSALQLDKIRRAKCLPIIRLAVKSPAQRVARCDVLEPEVDLFLGEAARPEPVDQDACPVVDARRLVNTLEDRRTHLLRSIKALSMFLRLKTPAALSAGWGPGHTPVGVASVLLSLRRRLPDRGRAPPSIAVTRQVRKNTNQTMPR